MSPHPESEWRSTGNEADSFGTPVEAGLGWGKGASAVFTKVNTWALRLLSKRSWRRVNTMVCSQLLFVSNPAPCNRSIHTEGELSDAVDKYFQREVKVMQEARHPNIVRVVTPTTPLSVPTKDPF